MFTLRNFTQNDLDLDFFCRVIIHADVERLKRVSCPNVYLGAHHTGAHVVADQQVSRVEAVFGSSPRVITQGLGT